MTLLLCFFSLIYLDILMVSSVRYCDFILLPSCYSFAKGHLRSGFPKRFLSWHTQLRTLILLTTFEHLLRSKFRDFFWKGIELLHTNKDVNSWLTWFFHVIVRKVWFYYNLIISISSTSLFVQKRHIIVVDNLNDK